MMSQAGPAVVATFKEYMLDLGDYFGESQR